MYNRPKANVFGRRNRVSESQDFRWTLWIQEINEITEDKDDLFDVACKYIEVGSRETEDDGTIFASADAQFRMRARDDIGERNYCALENNDGTRTEFGIIGIRTDTDRRYMTVFAKRWKEGG